MCFLNFETIRNIQKGWEHNDTIFTIPVGFRPKMNVLVLGLPRRKVKFDCRFVISTDGRCWIHSSEQASEFLKNDYWHFFGNWDTH